MTRGSRRFAWLLLSPTLLVMGLFLVLPLAATVVNSFHEYRSGVGEIEDSFTLENYIRFLADPYYWGILGRTLLISLEATVASVVLGLPVAVYLTRQTGLWRAVLTTIILAPMLISIVVRALGWLVVLGREGLLVQILGLFMDRPPMLLYTEWAVLIGLLQVFLPLMVLCIMSALLQIDPAVMRAAADLGATARQVFWKVVAPLSVPGIVAGSLLVFTLCAGNFAIPALLGGSRTKVMAHMVYQNQVLLLNWPFGAVLTVILLVTVGVCVVLYQAWLRRQRWAAALG